MFWSLPLIHAEPPRAHASWPRDGPNVSTNSAAPFAAASSSAWLRSLLHAVQPRVVAVGERQDVGAVALLRRDPRVADDEHARPWRPLVDPGQHGLDARLDVRDRRLHRVDAVAREVVFARVAGRVGRPQARAGRGQAAEDAEVVAADAEGDQVGVDAQGAQLRGVGAVEGHAPGDGSSSVVSAPAQLTSVNSPACSAFDHHGRVVRRRPAAAERVEPLDRDEGPGGVGVAEGDVVVEPRLRRSGGRGGGEQSGCRDDGDEQPGDAHEDPVLFRKRCVHF